MKIKTSLGILKEELINYRNESGNYSINIDLLIKGIDGIYGHNEKQNIINSVTYGNRMEFYDGTETSGEKYYNETFEEL